MKKIITIIAIASFISCSSSDEENEKLNSSLFIGKYFYVEIKNCKNDFLEFTENKIREVGFVIEAQSGGQNTCSNEIQGVDESVFTIINDSIITNGSGFLKITKQNNDTYRFIDSIDGMTLQDLITSDGSNADTWYMKRNK